MSLVVSQTQMLCTEHFPLGDLDSQNTVRPFSNEELLEICRQLLDALDYLHQRVPPICHGNVQPRSIMVTSRSPLKVKLSGFGAVPSPVPDFAAPLIN